MKCKPWGSWESYKSIKVLKDKQFLRPKIIQDEGRPKILHKNGIFEWTHSIKSTEDQTECGSGTIHEAWLSAFIGPSFKMQTSSRCKTQTSSLNYKWGNYFPACLHYGGVIFNGRFCVNDYWKNHCIQSKREKINIRINRTNIFLVNQIYKLGPYVAITLEISTQSGQEFSL